MRCFGFGVPPSDGMIASFHPRRLKAKRQIVPRVMSTLTYKHGNMLLGTFRIRLRGKRDGETAKIKQTVEIVTSDRHLLAEKIGGGESST